MEIAPERAGRAAVIDVGSNSVRLVVYDGLVRAPRALFNEKAMCGLGRGIAHSGRLHPQGKAEALAALRRFAILAESMAVDVLDAVATAAVRDAADGEDFLRQVEDSTGLRVRILDGAGEARVAAAGVLSAIPDAQGLVGDLGGGSLELVPIGGPGAATGVSLPLGVLRLMDGGASLDAMKTLIGESFASQPALDGLAGQQLYIVGGAWRALGRLHIKNSNHPLEILHGYRADAQGVIELCRLVARQGPKSLARLRVVSQARAAALPAAALLLGELLRRSGVAAAVFSAHGLREGLLYERLDKAAQNQDPLLAACRDAAGRTPHFGIDEEALMAWLAPLFRGETAALSRLRRAAVLLSESAWQVHPDYRARQAMADVMRGQYVGIDHRERVLLGLALRARYSHKDMAAAAEPYRALLHEDDERWCYRVGLALRLAHTLSGGIPELLNKFALEIKAGEMILRNLAGAPEPSSSVIAGRLGALAEAFGCEAKVIPAAPR